MKKIITVVIALTAACAAATIANAQTVTTPAEATTLAAAADTVKTAVADTVMVAAPAGVEVFQATGEKAPAKNTAKADKPANGQDKAAAAKADEKATKQAAAKTEAQQKAEEKAVKEDAKAAEQKPAEKAKAAEQPAEKAAAEKADEKAAKQPAAEKADEKAAAKEPVAEEQPAAEPETAEQPEEDLAAQPAEPMTAEELEAKKAEVAAQIAELEEMECESEFEKSTSLAVGLGAQYYMGENNKYWEEADLDIVTTKVLDFSVTRQHGPVFSWGADLNAAEYIGLYQITSPNAKFTTDEFIWKHTDAGKYYYRQSGWYARADLFAGFNVINIFRGYKEKPVFDLDAKIGAGAIFGVGSEDDQTSFAPQITAGLEAKFNITQRIAIKAAIRGAVVGDKFDGESRADEPDEVHKKANVPVDGIFGATVGVSFRLGKNSSIKEAKKAAEERDAQLEQLRAYQQLLEEAEVAE